jgi:hypothetical protein
MQNVVIKNRLVRGLCGRCYLSEAQNPIYTPPRLHTVPVFVYTGIQGRRGGRVEPERRLERQQFTKSRIPT